MKIAFDGSAFWETGMTYEEQYDTVARAGYEYINPYNADFPGFWKRPKATKEEVLWHKKAIADAGLKIASLTFVRERIMKIIPSANTAVSAVCHE